MQPELFDELRHTLREQADPVRAEGEKRYLKSDDRFLGVTVPAGRRIVATFRRTHNDLPFAEVRAVVAELWHSDFHEEKRLAVQLLDAYAAALTPEDWPLLADWVREAGNWDLIDEIAAHLLGTLCEKYPELDREFDVWITDENFWVRRAALVSHVLRIRHATVTTARVRELCTPLMTDRAYFVQKALGWVLRECAVRDPEGTVPFLCAWSGNTARLILREAVSKLDEASRQHVLVRK
ncbi:MAG: DNA alkylation repair protein [Armatimonadota bacterium]